MINKLFLFMFVGLSFAFAALATQDTYAVSGSDWNAGRIIDDSAFYDNTSMSTGSIQNFLSSKVPACDTNGTQSAADVGYPNMTHAQYAASRGWAGPPYVCLKDYHQVPRSDRIINNYSGSIPSGAISAAQIIKNAADTYGVSPKSLLVLLQKESPGPLITDKWPVQSQYRNAMGFGCPDTAPCDPTYEGFYNQMMNAARQFKLYKNSASSYRYKPFQNNSIYYNPNYGCGASNVYIQNYASAGLYNYTPYQPNKAALNNLYGTGDGCSAYGNRNFWRIYNDWFGGTQVPDYRAGYSSQGPYPSVLQSQSSTITLRYKNQGSLPWYDSSSAGAAKVQPVVLATMRPVNRCSAFMASSWYSCNRPTGIFSKVYETNGTTLAANQHVAQPSQIVEYTFNITAQAELQPGDYDEYFAPIREGISDWGWYMGADHVFMRVNVRNTHTASYSGQSDYPTISQNDRSDAYLRFKNNGVSTWYDQTTASANGAKPVVLATAGPVNRKSIFGASWTNGNRPGTTFSKVFESDGVTLAANQHVASPGQIIQYNFQLTALATASPQKYREYFQLIREGAASYIVDASGVYLDVTVQPSRYSATYSSQSAQLTMAKSSTAQMHYHIKNTGQTPWYDDASWSPGILPVHFATTNAINRSSKFADTSWPDPARPSKYFTKVYLQDGSTLAPNQHVVSPGQIARFEFTIKAPTSSGSYREDFQPIVEGSPGYSWNMNGGVWQSITVN